MSTVLLLLCAAAAVAQPPSHGVPPAHNASGAPPPHNKDPNLGSSRDWALLAATGTIILVFGQLLVLAMPPSEPWRSRMVALITICVGDITIAVGVIRHALLYHSSWQSSEAAVKIGLGIFFAILLVVFNALMLIMHRSASSLAAARIRKLEGALPQVLASGQMRLVSVKWLMRQPPGFVLPRRQDLEKIDGALVPPATAVRLLRDGRIACLSYKWLQEGRPDPEGFHLSAVTSFYFRAEFPITSAMRQLLYPALFWDWASCPQRDDDGTRTADEDAAFTSCLSVMNSVFATPRSLVLQHRRMPPQTGKGTLSYEQSGWCCVEQALASLAASAVCRVRHHELGMGWVMWEYVKLGPSEMRELLETKTFQREQDKARVARLYEELFEKVRAFDAANVPWLCVWADALVSRRPVQARVGMALLGVYAVSVLTVPFVAFAFPLHDGLEPYPLTSYAFALAISLLPFFMVIVPSDILYTHASLMVARLLLRIGLLGSGAADANGAGHRRPVEELFQERLECVRKEQTERRLLRRSTKMSCGRAPVNSDHSRSVFAGSQPILEVAPHASGDASPPEQAGQSVRSNKVMPVTVEEIPG